MDSVYVDIEYVKDLAVSLDNSKKTVGSLYETNFNKILLDSKNNFSDLHDDYYDRINHLKSLLNELEKEFTSLHKTMISDIIPGYEDVSSTIKRFFNIDFNDQMNEYLKIINN